MIPRIIIIELIFVGVLVGSALTTTMFYRDPVHLFLLGLSFIFMGFVLLQFTF